MLVGLPLGVLPGYAMIECDYFLARLRERVLQGRIDGRPDSAPMNRGDALALALLVYRVARGGGASNAQR